MRILSFSAGVRGAVLGACVGAIIGFGYLMPSTEVDGPPKSGVASTRGGYVRTAAYTAAGATPPRQPDDLKLKALDQLIRAAFHQQRIGESEAAVATLMSVPDKNARLFAAWRFLDEANRLNAKLEGSLKRLESFLPQILSLAVQEIEGESETPCIVFSWNVISEVAESYEVLGNPDEQKRILGVYRDVLMSELTHSSLDWEQSLMQRLGIPLRTPHKELGDRLQVNGIASLVNAPVTLWTSLGTIAGFFTMGMFKPGFERSVETFAAVLRRQRVPLPQEAEKVVDVDQGIQDPSGFVESGMGAETEGDFVANERHEKPR